LSFILFIQLSNIYCNPTRFGRLPNAAFCDKRRKKMRGSTAPFLCQALQSVPPPAQRLVEQSRKPDHCFCGPSPV
ncbi:MAG: hypothetical protein ACI3W8_04195, partial [Oscillospiraceae bacterium]